MSHHEKVHPHAAQASPIPRMPVPADFWQVQHNSKGPNNASSTIGHYPTPSNPGNDDPVALNTEYAEAMSRYKDAIDAYWAASSAAAAARENAAG